MLRPLAALLALLALACGPGAEVSSGREMYLAYGCAACHGVRGDGRGPAAGLSHTKPRDLRDLASYRGSKTDEGIASTIAFGIADGRTGMPAYPDIPKQERIAIARYILELAKEPRGVSVDNAWAAATNPASIVGAAYLTLTNDAAKHIALTGVTSSAANIVELHEMVSTNDMMTMRKVDRIDLAPRATITLAPGQSHLMLIGLKRQLRDGDTIELTLQFDDGSTEDVTAPVRGETIQATTVEATSTENAKVDFTLIDHDGRPFRSSSLRGKPALLFLGYTHCPDACPMTMSNLARAYREAGAEARDIPTLFVSVDPRDTPAILKEYLAYFGAVPAKGLTGSKAQIDEVVRQLGAKYEIRDSGSAAGPLVDHTLSIFLIGPDGRLKKKFHPTTDPSIIAGDMLQP
ncbi:MAG TPA: SCO family protein [Thermoanaerobaculia bacterium]|jgi:protein SCO1/2|nr:SCO family protein [Thermoanaerobaculia bacterium]